MEEEDGDRQKEEVEEKGEVESKRCAHEYDRRWKCECAQDLSHEVCVYHHKLWNKDACSLSACTPNVL